MKFMRWLEIIWLGFVVVTIVPAAAFTGLMWSGIAKHVVWRSGVVGYLPFKDVRAEDAALSWLRQRGKQNVRIAYEVDPEWAFCPRHARCYQYEAIDPLGRYEEGMVFTKPTAFDLL